MDKEFIRKKILKKRNSLDYLVRFDKSLSIQQKVLELDEIQNSEIVFSYVNFGSEVRTLDLFTYFLDNKILTCPKIISKTKILPYYLNSLSDLEEGKYNILTPKTKPYVGKIDVCITPCVAVTETGERLGWGNGYYDRFFEQHPESLKIALAYELQVVDNIPVKPHDKLMDLIITENRVISTKNYIGDNFKKP